MKTIIFLNIKGGVGKTATATTVAHMLATRYNKKVNGTKEGMER